MEKDQVLSGAQCRAARGLLGVSARELAGLAGVSWSTVQRFESGAVAIGLVRQALRQALEARGVEFIEGGAKLRSAA